MTDSPGPLAPREREVLQLLAEGVSVAAVAEQLSLTPYTVRSYLKLIHAKLDVLKTEAAVAVALRQGWIE